MLSIYQWVNGSLREVVTPDGPCWINLADPSTEEILRVQTLTGVSREFLSDPLDRDERPRMDVDDDGTVLIVVHIPYHEPDENLHPFNTLPLGVVHTECRSRVDLELGAQVCLSVMRRDSQGVSGIGSLYWPDQVSILLP